MKKELKLERENIIQKNEKRNEKRTFDMKEAKIVFKPFN